MKKQKKGVMGLLKDIGLIFFLVIVVNFGIDIYHAKSIFPGVAPQLIEQSVQGDHIDIIKMSQKKPVLVYFWGIWCPVCTRVSPYVNFMAQYYPVVSVALTSGDTSRVKQYLTAKKYNIETINDPKGLISRRWSVFATPTIFVVNKGKITSATTGFTTPMGMWIRLFFSG